MGVAVRTTQPLLVARPSTNLSTWQVPDTFADRLVQCQWWHEVQRPRWSPAMPLLVLALLAAVEEHLALGWSKDIPRNSYGCALIHLKGCEEFSPQELLGVSYPQLERPTWRIWEASQSCFFPKTRAQFLIQRRLQNDQNAFGRTVHDYNNWVLYIPLPAHLKVDLGTAMDCQVPHTLGLLS